MSVRVLQRNKIDRINIYVKIYFKELALMIMGLASLRNVGQACRLAGNSGRSYATVLRKNSFLSWKSEIFILRLIE